MKFLQKANIIAKGPVILYSVLLFFFSVLMKKLQRKILLFVGTNIFAHNCTKIVVFSQLYKLNRALSLNPFSTIKKLFTSQS